MDRQDIERCMAQVAAYRASGLKARVWAEANGVPLGTLGSWCGHFRRWQAKLDGSTDIASEAATPRPSGFVAARVAPAPPASSIRLELNAGAARLELHWPMANTRELAALLRELGR